ncbi:MAG: hypothetical protein AB8G96_02675 [Phycisphaerales bacterium]
MLLLIVAGVFVLRSSWFITGRVESTLSQMLGGPVNIERSAYLGDGRFRFQDVEIRAPGVAGEPGSIGRIDRVIVEVDPAALWRLSIIPRRVNLGRFRLRLSEDADAPGSFTFAAMRPNWSKRDDTNPTPEVSIDRLEIEVGEHRRLEYTPRMSRAFTASMRQATAEPGMPSLGPQWHDIELFELIAAAQNSHSSANRTPSESAVGGGATERSPANLGSDVAADTLADPPADPPADTAPSDDGTRSLVQPPPSERIQVRGRWNAATHAHTFTAKDLFLSEEVLALAPSIVREVMDEMELGGQARDLQVGWTNNAFNLEFQASDLVFRLPVDAGIEWARYRRGSVEPVEQRPMLRVDDGKFVFDGSSLRLEKLRGRIAPAAARSDVVSLPYEIDLTVSDLEPLAWTARADWARRALAAAPFALRFSTVVADVGESIDAEGDVRAKAIEVPVPIAGVLEQFEFEHWTLQTLVNIERAAGSERNGEPQAGAITSEGWASIRGTSGRYAKFPYRLENVTASVNFDPDRVTINHVIGEGGDGATVVLRGTIETGGPDPAVHLTLTGEDIPVDDRLREAFGPVLRDVLDRLRDPAAVASLTRHGLLAPEAKLGGRVDLRLSIDREAGADQPTVTTGEIGLREVDVILDRFPYPVTIERGTLALAANQLLISDPGDGMPVRTAGGGTGSLSGGVSWGESGGVRPDLHLEIIGDEIGPVLLAALPPSEVERSDGSDWSQWPGGRRARAGEWLHRLEIAGGLDFSCDVTSTESGEIDYIARVELQRASANAGAAIAVATGQADDAPLSGDWSLDSVRGTAIVTPVSLRLEAIAGATTGGTLDVNGELSLDGPARRVNLEIAADGLRVDSHLHDAIPPAARDRVDPILDRYRPRGSVDAILSIASDGMGDVDVRGRVTPSFLEVDLQSQPVQFTVDRGGIDLTFGSKGTASVRSETLELSFREPDGHEAWIGLSGGAIWGDRGTDAPPPAAVDLVAQWKDARLRSPLLAEILTAVDAEEQLDRMSEFSAAGRTDIDIMVRRGMEHLPALTATPDPEAAADGWRITAAPQDLSFRLRNTPVHLDLDPTSRVHIEPGRIRLADVSGSNPGGRFLINADVSTGEELTVDAELDVVGTLLGPQVAAFLPDGVRRSLENLALQERETSELRNVRLFARRRTPADAATETPAAWDVDFQGQLVLNDASIEAGMLFGSINGPFDVSLQTGVTQPLSVVIDARPTTFTLAGQTIRDLEARIRVHPDARRVEVEEVSGAIDTGRLVASASIGLDPGSTYDFNVDLAGAPLADFVLRNMEQSESSPDETTRHQLAGDLYARFAMTGRRGVPESRVGRGHALVNDADLFSIPSVLRFVQAIQFSPPAARYDYASSRFFLAGERLHIDELYLESQIAGTNTHTLTARGSVDLKTQAIDGRIRSRSGMLLPLREFVGGVGDALAAIELEGTLQEPGFRVELLRGNRREEEAVLARPRTAPPRVGAADVEPPSGQD